MANASFTSDQTLSAPSAYGGKESKPKMHDQTAAGHNLLHAQAASITIPWMSGQSHSESHVERFL